MYCIRFHSKDPNLVATGCFDRMIRIWSINSKKGSMDGQETDSSPVIMVSFSLINWPKSSGNPSGGVWFWLSSAFQLDNPASFVNCLEFHPSGKYLFAGDGEGSMYQWKCSSNSQRWSLDRFVPSCHKRHYFNCVLASLSLDFLIFRCIKLHEHSNRPINSITIHPTYGNKLLVHSRDSCLKIVEIGRASCRERV